MAGATLHDRAIITPSVNSVMNKYGNGCDNNNNNAGYMQSQTMIGEDFVGPGLSSQLERFYHKARPADKAKCIELLTAINIQREIKSKNKQRSNLPSRSQTPGPSSYRPGVYTPQPPRPMTAMAAATEERVKSGLSKIYQTTYSLEYTQPEKEPELAWRPRSTKHTIFAPHNSGGHVGDTQYSDQFCGQNTYQAHVEQQEHELARNNPQSPEKFMVWRFPRHAPKFKGRKFPEDLTYEAMEKICRGKCRSTYDADFNGIPQGFDVSSAFKLPEDWRGKVPYSLASSMRHSYRKPHQLSAVLSGATYTRNGSNKDSKEAAQGAVPAVSKPQLHLNPRTTYDREYIDPMSGSGQYVPDIRHISKRLGAETLQHRMEQCHTDAEREAMKQMLKSMRSPTPPTCPKSYHTSGRSKGVTYAPEEFDPSWLSTWTGPV